MTTISVLICTLNRHWLLEKTLDSLTATQVDKPDQIVVVNGGDDQASLVVKKFQAGTEVEVELVETTNRNLATSRNLGLRRCKGKIIAMTDDDAIVFPDWIGRLKTLHRQHPEAGAVGGMVLGFDQNSRISRVADIVTFPRWEDECFVRTLPGVNISYKREVLQQVGLQDESLARGEDVDFNWRVLQIGFKILYSPSVKVYHVHRPSIGGLFRQQYMYGRSYVLVRDKHRDMYSVFPQLQFSIANVAKVIKFGVSTVSQPILATKRLHGLDRITCLPLLLMLEIAWRLGMVRSGLTRRS